MSPQRPEVTVVGPRLDPEDHRLRDFLTRAAQPFRWLAVGTPAVRELLASRGLDEDSLPVLIDADDVFAPASVERFAEAWRISIPPGSAPQRYM